MLFERQGREMEASYKKHNHVFFGIKTDLLNQSADKYTSF